MASGDSLGSRDNATPKEDSLIEVQDVVKSLLQSSNLSSGESSAPFGDPTTVTSADANVDKPLTAGVEAKTTKPVAL